MPEVECGFADEPPVFGSELLIRNGPVITVNVEFAPGGGAPPASRQVTALVDTGATDSCIDDSLARDLQLVAVDQKIIVGIGGSQEANMYIAEIHAPALEFTQYGAFAGVDLSELEYGAVIGRRFLRKFKMVYDGATGSVVISRVQM